MVVLVSCREFKHSVFQCARVNISVKNKSTFLFITILFLHLFTGRHHFLSAYAECIQNNQRNGSFCLFDTINFCKWNFSCDCDSFRLWMKIYCSVKISSALVDCVRACVRALINKNVHIFYLKTVFFNHRTKKKLSCWTNVKLV